MAEVATPEQPHDYLSNLEVVERFPFNLYHGPIRSMVLHQLQAEADRKGPLRILNVGCGLSQILQYIEARHSYHGVDLDPRAIEICQARFQRPGVSFSACQNYALGVDSGSFDFVFATEVIEHVLEPERWLREVVRTLRPGGLVQLSTPNYGGWLLPLIEKTFLEWMARRQGFTRVGLHPTPFNRKRLQAILEECGLVEVGTALTPAGLALIGWGRLADV